MSSLFQLPDEVLLAPLLTRFPSRETQIRTLATLFHPTAAPCSNVMIHGTSSTGKTAVTTALLEALSAASPLLRHAIVGCAQCITARHLYERVLAAVADALGWGAPPRRCESLAQLLVGLQRLVEMESPLRRPGERFVLVLDGVDRQREAPVTLLPGLARLHEMIPSLSIVYIVTSPQPVMLRLSAAPHVHFPAYTKPEFMRIMNATTTPPPISALSSSSSSSPSSSPTPSSSASSPPAPTDPLAANHAGPDPALIELWSRFCTAVHDALARPAARTLPTLQHACLALWPRFTAPIRSGDLLPRDFSRLLVAARVHFHDESLLCPSIISARPANPTGVPSAPGLGRPSLSTTTTPSSTPKKAASTTTVTTTAIPTTITTSTTTPELATILPRTARLILLASYLASHNAAKHDLTLFSTHHHGKRRRRGGGGGTPRGGARSAAGKHRKIARRLLGAQAFVLERMMAIFAAVRSEWVGDGGGEGGGGGGPVNAGLDGDVAMAVSTLASLRLLVRVGASADLMDRGGKWRINVGWDMVRALGRSMGVEMEDWLIE